MASIVDELSIIRCDVYAKLKLITDILLTARLYLRSYNDIQE